MKYYPPPPFFSLLSPRFPFLVNFLKLEAQYEERETKCVGSAGKELASELEGSILLSVDVQMRAAMVRTGHLGVKE